MPYAVDPRFGPELRRLRTAAGLSLRTLAAEVYQGKSHLHDLEAGRRPPTEDLARRLDDALGGSGQLVELARPMLPPDQASRLGYAVQHPQRTDSAAVDALAGLLAAQRRLEDSIGAVAVLPAAHAHLELITALLGDARGEVRHRLVDLAAQWAQFVGWLNIAAGDPVTAGRWLDQGLMWATEADSGGRDDQASMVATILSFRGHLAETLGRHGDAVGMSMAAGRDGRVYPGLRAYCAGQAARALALAGAEPGEILPLLDQARDLADEQAEQPLPEWGYWYTPDFFLVQRGLVLRNLAESDRRYAGRAVELLSAGIDQAAPEVTGSDWHGLYLVRLAESLALDGQRDEARLTLGRAAEIAAITRSSPLAGLVSTAAGRLSMSMDTGGTDSP